MELALERLKIILLAGRIIGVLTLEKLLATPELAEVVAVVPGDNQVSEFARSKGVHVIQSSDINSQEFVSQVKELGTELMINVFFLQKYRSKLLEATKFGTINVHPSKLPFYRGRDCVRWAMVNGEKEIGVTVHQMDDALDTGAIILQDSFPVDLNDNYMEVFDKLKSVYPKIVVEAVQLISSGKVQRKMQNPAEEGTYFTHRLPEDSRINWGDASLEIHNLIRASFEPGFYAYSTLEGKKIFITEAGLKPHSPYETLKMGSSQRQGRVLDYDPSDPKSSVLVGTADGVISVKKCILEGTQESVKATSILKRGNRLV